MMASHIGLGIQKSPLGVSCQTLSRRARSLLRNTESFERRQHRSYHSRQSSSLICILNHYPHSMAELPKNNGKVNNKMGYSQYSVLQSSQPQTRFFHSNIVHFSDVTEKVYSTPELTADAARHKAGLIDENVPPWQNPLHHENEEMQKTFPEDFESTEAFEAAKVPAPSFDREDGKVSAPQYLHDIADEIVHLTMLEMSELISKVADHYGFHEGMLSPDDDELGASGDVADEDNDGAAAELAVAKTKFDVRLVEFDASAKIKVIKEVRALAGLGLKEAKELVEGAPKTIVKDMSKEQAEEIKAKLEEIGAKIEIV